MDKEFSWNLPDINALREQREREQLGLVESEARKARRTLQFQNAMDAAKQAEEAEAAENAQRARWLQLEDKFAHRTMNPKMKMAAMLAMGGQPGALQQMFISDDTNGKEAQSAMDNLEASIANDMFALASADKDTFAKLTGAILPLYKSKFEELLSKGAKSRMGGDWATGWGSHFENMKTTRKKRKDEAKAKDKADDALVPQ